MPILTETTKIVIGVDTHRDTHTAAVIDTTTGALIETIQVTNDPTGYALLVSAAHKHAVPRQSGRQLKLEKSKYRNSDNAGQCKFIIVFDE